MHASESRKGTLLALGAFLMWGCFPFYWRALSAFDPATILAHRIAWSFAFAFALLKPLRKGSLKKAFAGARASLTVLGSGLLVGVNWLLYIIAVNSGNTVQASLGYYMTPVFSGVLGFIFLRERPKPLQVAAFAVASVGVGIMAANYGQAPWLAISLMATFGFYGLIKKTMSLDPLVALAGETAVLAPFALAGLVVSFLSGAPAAKAFVSGLLGAREPINAVATPLAGAGYGPLEIALLVLAGPVTAFPLWLYALGAKKIPLYAVGFLQFVSPSIQLAIGVLVFGEPFGSDSAIAFAFIWGALALYSLSFVSMKRRAPVRAGG
jgi:chloramphenicol-sensitive protein RarD